MAKTFELSQVLSGLEIDAPTATALLTLNTNTGGQSAVTGEEAGVSRWQVVFGDTTPETGTDTGSNFKINAYHDNGSFLATPLSITRSSGQTSILSLKLAGTPNISIGGGSAGNVLATDGVGGLSWSTAGTVSEAPIDTKVYGRSNQAWVVLPDLIDAPINGQLYGRENANWVVIPPPGITDAPNDGQTYGRRSNAWALVGGSIGEAPQDGTAYVRKSGAWANLTHTDITDWTTTLAPYALTTAIPGASAITPTMNGTASIGTATTWARADHVHPSDTTKYNASNPSGYQTAAQVSSAIAASAYVLPTASTTLLGGVKVDGTTITINGGVITSLGAGGGITDAPNDGTTYARKSAAWSHLTHNDITDWLVNVPAASTTTPTMNGTAVVGSATTWARADHVHPSDTTKYSTTNPSGYQTAAQVTAALGAYLPLAGGTLTGQLNGTNANFSGTITAPMVVSSTTSDARVKQVLDDYRPGLEEISQLHPVAFRFKGNEASTAQGVSPHNEDAKNRMVHIGLIAQEVEQLFPGMVSMHKAFIDGQEVNDLRKLNTSELIYALVNSVKTLKSQIDQLRDELSEVRPRR